VTKQNIECLQVSFKSLDPAAKYMSRLARYCTEQQFPTNALIFTNEEARKECYLIREGTVQLESDRIPLAKRVKENGYD
jgi:hypothetical protein